MPHLKLDQALIDEARSLARHIVTPVIDYIAAHTTVAIERTTLRLLGVDGVDEGGVPLPNCVVDSARSLLPGGILRPFVTAMLELGLDAQATAEAIGRGECSLLAVSSDEARLEKIDAEARRNYYRSYLLSTRRYCLSYQWKQASSSVVETLSEKYVDRQLSE